MISKLFFPSLFLLALSSCTTPDEENLHSFATGKRFTDWKANEQIHYAMGLADAFTYLAKRENFMEGISKCYRENKMISARLMNQFEGYIESPGAYYKNYSGQSLKILPAAEAFYRFNKLLCDEIVKDDK